MKDIVVLIPAYNPTDNLYKLVLELINLKFQKIIIVNDGSNKKNKIFPKLKEFSECDLLEYTENKGKGYALKFGINYYLENYKTEYKGIVTADADYQHLPNDILNISLKLIGNLDSLVLGCRNFDLDTVPNLNRFGNKLTSFIFKLLYGKKVNDTQTGLRGIPNRYLNLALEANGNRFEYEMNMLIKLSGKNINFLCIPIETVYYEESESKFNKLVDSFTIYRVLFSEYIKFFLSGFLCFFIDIILFILIGKLLNVIDINIRIILATCIARIVSSFINFNINKNFVFKSHEKNNIILTKYYLLCILRTLMSAGLVVILYNLFKIIDETIIKIIVEIFLYFISYRIQKKYIFKT